MEKVGAKDIEGSVSPMANSVSEDGLLSVEAAFVGKIDGQDAKGIVTAQFAQDGEIKEFEFCRIS